MVERFSSLDYAPTETRRILRERLAGFLPASHLSWHQGEGEAVLSDEAMLRLLLSLTMTFDADVTTARSIYEAARVPPSGEPTLEQLVESGWFRALWGRLSAPTDVALAAAAAQPPLPALSHLMMKRHVRTYHWAAAARDDPGLGAVIDAIELEDLRLSNVGCQSPEWVAARLWDRTCKVDEDLVATLRTWLDRWRLLGAPSFVVADVWDEERANAFLDTVLAVIRQEAGLVGWEAARAQFVRQLALGSRQEEAALDDAIPRIPASTIDRALWFDGPAIERALMNTFVQADDFFGLVRLLLTDVAASDYSSAPNVRAATLLSLALDRPEILAIVLAQVRNRSVLLADVLLHPPTTALGCLLIADWVFPLGAWDRETRLQDYRRARLSAFEDGISILGHFLASGGLASDEVAALLKHLHRRRRRTREADDGQDSLLRALRDELARQDPAILLSIADILILSSKPHPGLETHEFRAALDVVVLGALVDDVDPSPFVDAYVRSFKTADHGLSADGIDAEAAATLFRLAKRTSPDLFKRFLNPISVPEEPTDAACAFARGDAIARCLRTQIRVTCRAIAGLHEPAPRELIDALIVGVAEGVRTDAQTRLVGTFSPSGAAGFFERTEKLIADDLGAALRALEGDERRLLLDAVLSIDEPLVLAQLLAYAPQDTLGRIRERITGLDPTNVGAIHSLPEAQARIDALLSAGMADTAAVFMADEADLKTWGKIPEREAMRLKNALRLLLLRGDWAAIAAVEVPSGLVGVQRQAADETIAFYKALAALNGPDANVALAASIFQRLLNQRPGVAAYAVNLVAARIRELLGDDAFRTLHGGDITRGRKVLKDAQHAMAKVQAQTENDEAAYRCNCAVLLMALGRPTTALEHLLDLNLIGQGDVVAAYRAVAYARTGQIREAIAALDGAAQEFGETAALHGAREHIKLGSAYAATTVTITNDDPIPRIQAALFEFRQLDPVRQAQVLQPAPDSFLEYVIEVVRMAAASIVALVPMMRALNLTSREDDISAVIRELLTARLDHVGWSAPDQSLGGFTAKGNPGERDLLLKRGSNVLAVMEAVVCRAQVSYQNLTSHFTKLFGYAPCGVLIYLTYSFMPDTKDILAHLKQIAANSAPTGFTFQSSHAIVKDGIKPIGFKARYRADGEDVWMVFLIIDLDQSRQRTAAIEAAS